MHALSSRAALAAAVLLGSALPAQADLAALDAKNGFQTWKLNSPVTPAVKAKGVWLDRYDGAVTYNAFKTKFGQASVFVKLSYYKNRLYDIEVSTPSVPGMYDDPSLRQRSTKAFYESFVSAYGEPSPCGVVECWTGKKVQLTWYGSQGDGGVRFRYLPIEAAIKGGRAAQQRAEEARKKTMFDGAQGDL